MREEVDIVGKGKLLRNFAFGIVVAADNEDANPGLFAPVHLPDEKEAGVEIGPISVKKIAGNDDEIDFLGEGQLDQIFKGPPARHADFGYGRPFVLFQAAQRAVEVNIGAVYELQRSSPRNVGYSQICTI